MKRPPPPKKMDLKHASRKPWELCKVNLFSDICRWHIFSPCGRQSLGNFLVCLNGIHPTIKISIEKEGKERLPLLLSWFITQGRVLWGIETTESPYILICILIMQVITTLHKINCAFNPYTKGRTVADPQNLQPELRHLRKEFQQNGYKRRNIQ